mgnify:CR=1 FL=1
MSSAPVQPTSHSEQQPFSVRTARTICADLFAHREWIYWTDLCVCLVLGYGGALWFFSLPWFTLEQLVVLCVSGFALFRMGTFIHEVQHFPPGVMQRFARFWEVACGVPMLMPSFFYDSHLDHHRSTTYGTRRDGEYLPLATGPLRHFAVYALEALLIPIFVGVRFAVLTPVSFLHPKLRRVILERFSFYGINPGYRRTLPAPGPPRWWAVVEWACFARCMATLAVILLGLYTWDHLTQYYLLAVFTLGLNYVRNLIAHRYRNQGEQLSYLEQLDDSCNLESRNPLTELFFPLGLRYHALHHLLPTLPYHNLYAAHRRLMAELPADSPYRATVLRSFSEGVRQLWNESRAARMASKVDAATPDVRAEAA